LHWGRSILSGQAVFALLRFAPARASYSSPLTLSFFFSRTLSPSDHFCSRSSPQSGLRSPFPDQDFLCLSGYGAGCLSPPYCFFFSFLTTLFSAAQTALFSAVSCPLRRLRCYHLFCWISCSNFGVNGAPRQLLGEGVQRFCAAMSLPSNVFVFAQQFSFFFQKTQYNFCLPDSVPLPGFFWTRSPFSSTVPYLPVRARLFSRPPPHQIGVSFPPPQKLTLESSMTAPLSPEL